MTFEVAADAYDRFIGRYSRELAPRFLAFAEISAGPVLEVGCGPGELTSILAARFGASQVAAIEPSPPFVEACRDRIPGADVRAGAAEALPFADRSFEGVLSQLVLSFVRDADRAAAEMARVTRPGGVIAASTFEADGFALARTFWDAALRFDPDAPDDAGLPFRRLPELVALWQGAGLHQVTTAVIDVAATYADFDDFWSPFAFGVGPTSDYLVHQPDSRRAAIREACFERIGRPTRSFTLPARVLAIRGRV